MRVTTTITSTYTVIEQSAESDTERQPEGKKERESDKKEILCKSDYNLSF